MDNETCFFQFVGSRNWRTTKCCSEPWAACENVDRIYWTAVRDSWCRNCGHGTEAVGALKFGGFCPVALLLTMFGTLVTHVFKIWKFCFSQITQHSDTQTEIFD